MTDSTGSRPAGLGIARTLALFTGTFVALSIVANLAGPLVWRESARGIDREAACASAAAVAARWEAAPDRVPKDHGHPVYGADAIVFPEGGPDDACAEDVRPGDDGIPHPRRRPNVRAQAVCDPDGRLLPEVRALLATADRPSCHMLGNHDRMTAVIAVFDRSSVTGGKAVGLAVTKVWHWLPRTRWIAIAVLALVLLAASAALALRGSPRALETATGLAAMLPFVVYLVAVQKMPDDLDRLSTVAREFSISSSLALVGGALWFLSRRRESRASVLAAFVAAFLLVVVGGPQGTSDWDNALGLALLSSSAGVGLALFVWALPRGRPATLIAATVAALLAGGGHAVGNRLDHAEAELARTLHLAESWQAAMVYAGPSADLERFAQRVGSDGEPPLVTVVPASGAGVPLTSGALRAGRKEARIVFAAGPVDLVLDRSRVASIERGFAAVQFALALLVVLVTLGVVGVAVRGSRMAPEGRGSPAGTDRRMKVPARLVDVFSADRMLPVLVAAAAIVQVAAAAGFVRSAWLGPAPARPLHLVDVEGRVVETRFSLGGPLLSFGDRVIARVYGHGSAEHPSMSHLARLDLGAAEGQLLAALPDLAELRAAVQVEDGSILTLAGNDDSNVLVRVPPAGPATTIPGPPIQFQDDLLGIGLELGQPVVFTAGAEGTHVHRREPDKTWRAYEYPLPQPAAGVQALSMIERAARTLVPASGPRAWLAARHRGRPDDAPGTGFRRRPPGAKMQPDFRVGPAGLDELVSYGRAGVLEVPDEAGRLIVDSSGDLLTVARESGEARAIAQSPGGVKAVLASSDGGFDIVFFGGQTVRVGPDLIRREEPGVEGPGVFQRLAAVSGRLWTSRFATTFWVHWTPMRFAALPVMLFGFPVLALLALLCRRLRQPAMRSSRRAWLAGAAALYLVGAWQFAPTFLEVLKSL